MTLNKQQGFTLIELIMVIVILGILAAVALPKFANLGGDARKASLQGALGSVKSAAAIVHSKALIDGTTKAASSSVALEGDSAVATAYGYPANSAIQNAAGIADFKVAVANGVATISASNDGGSTAVADCNFTYQAPSAEDTAPVISAITDSGC